MDTIFNTLFLLLVVHWVCDYPLQGEFLSRVKVHGPLRVYHLIVHTGIQAGGVYLVTQNIWFALTEWVLHTIIDELKNKNVTSFSEDQMLHIFCKVLYIFIMIFFL